MRLGAQGGIKAGKRRRHEDAYLVECTCVVSVGALVAARFGE